MFLVNMHLVENAKDSSILTAMYNLTSHDLTAINLTINKKELLNGS